MNFLSGIQPSNTLHIGNYFGAIKQFIEFQKEREGIIMIADLHALTTSNDPKQLQKHIKTITATYLAAGIDTEKNILFQQSAVKEHTELAWIFSTILRMSELERMTQYKDKAIVHGQNVNIGIFTYPLLMAADILLYSPMAVPIGEDQKQHVELTRNIAERFNSTYTETFRIPEPVMAKVGAKIMGLDDPSKKMSKSAPSEKNYISLMDNEDTIKKKIMSAVTDDKNEINYTEEQPGIKNLLDIYGLLTDASPKTIAETFKDKGYGDLKKAVAEELISYLIPLQERINHHLENEKALNEILEKGAERAKKIASKKMQEVKAAVGLI